MPFLAIIFLPWIAAVSGAVASTFYKPGQMVRSAIQHFAAGIIFAAAAGEILPALRHGNPVVPVVIGGSIGIAAMLAARSLGNRASGPASLIGLVGLDVFIDGLVLGIALVAGQKQGLLLAVALTIEVLFLGLTIALALRGGASSRLKTVGITAAVAALLPLGALLGGPISTLPPAFVTGFFAFGLMALLYLVTEELLKEAHERPDPPWVTAMFFVGFLLLIVLDEIVSA